MNRLNKFSASALLLIAGAIASRAVFKSHLVPIGVTEKTEQNPVDNNTLSEGERPVQSVVAVPKSSPLKSHPSLIAMGQGSKYAEVPKNLIVEFKVIEGLAVAYVTP